MPINFLFTTASGAMIIIHAAESPIPPERSISCSIIDTLPDNVFVNITAIDIIEKDINVIKFPFFVLSIKYPAIIPNGIPNKPKYPAYLFASVLFIPYICSYIIGNIFINVNKINAIHP